MSHRRRIELLVAHNRRPQRPTAGGTPRLSRSAAEEPVVAETFRRDYVPPDFLVPNIKLWFTLGTGEEPTTVRCELFVNRSDTCRPGAELLLNGDELELHYVTIDGVSLSPAQYTILPGVNATCNMSIPASSLPSGDRFTVETEVTIHPHANSKNLGLYLSHGTLATMCEAEGFRRIAYHIDRPDILAIYEVYVEGDEGEFPVLLSNGNQLEAGKLPGGRHFTRWLDPFPKPCYIFALVGGDLGCLEDHYTTSSGKDVTLRIWSEHDAVSRCGFAMQSLKDSMAWDEREFGLEYDLDLFNIVAVAHAGGAMENKSLNIFSTGLVVATPRTNTDASMESVMRVIAHEYFHNFTGNRITCRDWFQLTLKEGLTVYRDQRFTADQTAPALKRIKDAMAIQTSQFAEDAGGMAHPIRPESYIAIWNFYSRTVYDKGAEVIRMYETLLGREGFRKGMDLYFDRHDGTAATCDDFRAAMADANAPGLLPPQFEEWYLQAGTPSVTAELSHYNCDTGEVTLTLTQFCAPTPGQPQKRPFLIPCAVGLLDPVTGVDLLSEPSGTAVLRLTEPTQTFTLAANGCGPTPPVLSFMRQFSAPVRSTVIGRTVADEAHIMAYDSDSYNAWKAAQSLAALAIVESELSEEAKASYLLSTAKLLDSVLADDGTTDWALVAEIAKVPSMVALSDSVAATGAALDPILLNSQRQELVTAIGVQMRPQLWAIYEAQYAAQRDQCMDGDTSSLAVGKRAICEMALRYLMATPDGANCTATIPIVLILPPSFPPPPHCKPTMVHYFWLGVGHPVQNRRLRLR